MKDAVASWVLAALTLGSTFVAVAQSTATGPSADPLPSELEEAVDVHLILLDTVVVDRAGRTVADLTADDFEIVVDGEAVEVDTLDASCNEAREDARAVRNPRNRPPLPTDAPRRIVILIDYMHLGILEVTEVLEGARRMVRHGMTDRDEVMVAALTLGLRIEQPFTSDRERVEDVLERMEYDISLWNGRYNHLTEEPFFTSMQGLFQVLGEVPGHKGIVLYSNNGAPSDEEDRSFALLAASASNSRCSIYPVHAVGLIARPG